MFVIAEVPSIVTELSASVLNITSGIAVHIMIITTHSIAVTTNSIAVTTNPIAVTTNFVVITTNSIAVTTIAASGERAAHGFVIVTIRVLKPIIKMCNTNGQALEDAMIVGSRITVMSIAEIINWWSPPAELTANRDCQVG
ncbi:hypothetical protein PF007_g31776 [Phytophthora fragariae]|uniref:Uncharacterized protein n=1 Tax=Phytophthora fragariae TaxID=53985 RepID=A0A6A3PRU1_9STRA|nr:hypothetical protein PF007_g31776 [Phytophthora fragariae]